MRTVVCIASLALILATVGVHAEGAWYRGNVHCHTNNSDGNSTLSVVSDWYRSHNYDFLFVTDHNKRTPLDEMQGELDKEAGAGKRRLLLIGGEELTTNMTVDGRGYAMHVNALGTTHTIGKQTAPTVREVLSKEIAAAIAAGALPQVNHPNYKWSLTAEDIAPLPTPLLMELFNGCGETSFGGGGQPSVEGIWDTLLTSGTRVWGTAADDAHDFTTPCCDCCNPGRGFVFVRAAELSPAAIVDALRRGNFYASTGVELKDVKMGGGRLSLEIKRHKTCLYTTTFVGENGRVIRTDGSLTPSCELPPDSGYVRARVMSSNGYYAWTQPLFAAGAQNR